MASRPQLNQSEVGRLDGKVVVLGRWLYDFLRELTRNPDNAIYSPTVGASPYTLTNATGYPMEVLVSGGTVSGIELVRGGVYIPVASGTRLDPGDGLRVTYSVAPTMTVIPR